MTPEQIDAAWDEVSKKREAVRRVRDAQRSIAFWDEKIREADACRLAECGHLQTALRLCAELGIELEEKK